MRSGSRGFESLLWRDSFPRGGRSAVIRIYRWGTGTPVSTGVSIVIPRLDDHGVSDERGVGHNTRAWRVSFVPPVCCFCISVWYLTGDVVVFCRFVWDIPNQESLLALGGSRLNRDFTWFNIFPSAIETFYPHYLNLYWSWWLFFTYTYTFWVAYSKVQLARERGQPHSGEAIIVGLLITLNALLRLVHRMKVSLSICIITKTY